MELAMRSANDTLAEREKQQIARAVEVHGEDGAYDLTNEEFVSTQLANRIRKAWFRNRGDKTRVEKILLRCLRARKGEYHPSKLAEIRQAGGSEIYVKSTTAKIRTGIAHSKAILLPNGSWSHGINPTRNPELPQWMIDEATLYLQQNPLFLDEQGKPVELDQQADQMEHMLRVQLQERAKQAARRMEAKIYDQLQEGGFRNALSDLIDDLFTYTAAFLKGPYFVNKPRLTWAMGPLGVYEPVRTIEPVMQFRTINPLDAYPAPGADSVHKGDFIERLRLSRDELFAMKDTPDLYDVDAINRVLKNESGYRLENWLWTDSERQNIAEHTYFWYESTSDIDGLHWYGEAMGYELLEHGVPAHRIDDPNRNYQVDAILIGNEVIKATLNSDPLYRRNVNSTCYENIPGSVFGNSVATLMEDSQAMINGTARALQNNLAHASGFQVEVDYTRLHGETDPNDIYPFKVWQGRESEYSGNRPVVQFFQPESNATELIGVMKEFQSQATKDTGIPDFVGGSSAAEPATAQAVATVKSEEAKLLRSAITNLDEDIISPTLEMVYDHNMLYDQDESIKGDTQVVAKGMNAALQREGSRQEHMAVLDLLGNDYDRNLIGDERRYELIRNLMDTFEEIDTDAIIPTNEEIKFKLKQMAEAPPPPDPQMIKIENDAVMDKQRLEFDKQKAASEEAFNREKMAAEIQRQFLDNQAKIQTSRDDLDLKMQNEITKLRAARHSAFEIGAQDASKLQMQLEAKAKEQMQKLRNDITLARETAKMAANDVRNTQPNSDTEESSAMSPEEIQAAVQTVMLPLITEFKADTMKVIDNLSAMMQKEGESQQDINVHVNMPTSGKKTISTSRDASGNLQATVNEEGV